MPIISSAYSPPWYLPGGTLQTLVAARLPRPLIEFRRETLELEDGDFLDLDWLENQASRLIIVTHGLEGSSQSQYIRDICRDSQQARFDILAWNCRSCSGRMNRLPRLYHHGEIEDISTVIDHVRANYHYKEIFLAGISMGGNISIKYLGNRIESTRLIKACATISTPCDLGAAAAAMDKPKNRILKFYFLRNLKKKMAAKEAQFPGSFPMDKFDSMKTWRQFDAEFVAPFIGFNSVEEFYHQASANTHLHKVERPVLIINAINDPVLSQSCHPVVLAKKMDNITLELPTQGGHAYFPMRGNNYAARRIMQYFNALSDG